MTVQLLQFLIACVMYILKFLQEKDLYTIKMKKKNTHKDKTRYQKKEEIIKFSPC
jgi:hypothetical protein